MNPSTKLFVSTLALASLGVFASPAALADNGEAGSVPGESAKFVSTLSRAEVRAEAVRALRAGEIAYGEFGAARNDFLARSVAVKSRAQVLAELAEARRLGLVGGHWHDNDVVPTAEQARSIAEAGERVAAVRVTSR